MKIIKILLIMLLFMIMFLSVAEIIMGSNIFYISAIGSAYLIISLIKEEYDQ
mgnify:CR=1 FL=1